MPTKYGLASVPAPARTKPPPAITSVISLPTIASSFDHTGSVTPIPLFTKRKTWLSVGAGPPDNLQLFVKAFQYITCELVVPLASLLKVTA